MSQSVFDEGFARAPVIAILRGLEPSRAVAVAEAAWAVGIDLVEVTVETPGGFDALVAVVESGLQRRRPVGAGTVTTPELAEKAAAVGAVFSVAPGWDVAVARASQAAGLAHLPGVATATELMDALNHGFEWVKMFPAAVLGVAWASALRGPFPQVKLVATGGLDVARAADFLAAGVDAVGLGSALADPGQRPELSTLLARATRNGPVRFPTQDAQ